MYYPLNFSKGIEQGYKASYKIKIYISVGIPRSISGFKYLALN